MSVKITYLTKSRKIETYEHSTPSATIKFPEDVFILDVYQGKPGDYNGVSLTPIEQLYQRGLLELCHIQDEHFRSITTSFFMNFQHFYDGAEKHQMRLYLEEMAVTYMQAITGVRTGLHAFGAPVYIVVSDVCDGKKQGNAIVIQPGVPTLCDEITTRVGYVSYWGYQY